MSKLHSTFETLQYLTTRFSLAERAEDIGRALFDVSQRYGYTAALIVDMRKLVGPIGPAIVFATRGRGLIELADTENPFIGHPFTVQAQASERPFVVSDLRRENRDGEDAWWSFMSDRAGKMDGIVIPVHDGDDIVWFSAFVGSEPDLSQRTLSLMSAAVHAGFARYCDLANADGVRNGALTPRDAECLHWIADGKTDSQVAAILQISPRTVRFHIDNAKTKLGASTRVQAVAKRLNGAI